MLKIIQKKRPRIRPYGFTISVDAFSGADDIFEVYSWLLNNISLYDKSRMEFRINNAWTTSIYFEHASDAAAFKLRWI